MATEDRRARNELLVQALHARVEEYQQIIESNLNLRAAILREANRLEAAFANQPTLAPADLKLVSEGAGKYLRLRNELMALADRYQPVFNYTEDELIRAGVDPRIRLVAGMVSISAALTLYDNYVTTVARFEHSPTLRRYINEGDSATGMNKRALEEIGMSARSLINRGLLRTALQNTAEWQAKYEAWRWQFAPVTGHLDVLENDYLYLDTLIRSSITYRFIVDVQPLGMTLTKLDSTLGSTLPDFLKMGSETSLRTLSLVFVHAIGLVDQRPGLIHADSQRRADALATLNRTLKAGDILIEKSPFRLSDRLVPGYFGHSGIWLGSEDELTALGVWNDPRLRNLPPKELARLRAQIREGRAVIEALRPGVVLNTLEHFINVDDLLVLRPRLNEDSSRAEDRREALVTAITHFGKSYDFSFDIHSRRRIICSELTFQSYTQPEFEWPKHKSLGRYTIRPDDVVSRSMPTTNATLPLRMLLFYHRGLLEPGGPDDWAKKIARLIQQPGNATNR